MNDALDDVRAEEARALARNGREPVFKKSRWCLLKRVGNLTVNQKGRLKELLRYNLKSVRAYLLKEDFQQLWTYQSPTWAGKFLDTWCTTALRSRIEPMKKIARMCRRHRPLILNWFKAKGAISNGVVEGLNNKAKLTIRKILWFPISGDPRNGVISCTWQDSRAKAHPRILLRSLFFSSDTN
jgi:transposase